MKVMVKGNIVETDYIYRISDIKVDDGHGSFTIHFVNSQSLKIIDNYTEDYINNNGLIGEELFYNINDHRKLLNLKCKEKLIKIRDFIISHWNSDNLNMPKID